MFNHCHPFLRFALDEEVESPQPTQGDPNSQPNRNPNAPEGKWALHNVNAVPNSIILHADGREQELPDEVNGMYDQEADYTAEKEVDAKSANIVRL